MTALPLPAAAGRPRAPRKSSWFGGSMPAARFGLIVNLIVPGAILVWDALHHQLGVNAENFAIKTTGLIAVTYLLISLAVTPIMSLTHQSWLVQFRRALGCYACYFAAAHLFIYFWWDQGRSVSSTAYEITHRFYLMVGFMSLVLMLPLLATSFNAAIRWMGGRKWKLLHRLAYPAALLACYHYYLQSKADKSKPNVYFAVLGVLLLYRVAAGILHFSTRRRQATLSADTSMATPGKMRFWKGPLKVVAIFQETASVRTFRLAPPDGSPIPFRYRAGQYLSLTLPIDGKPAARSYTIAGSPTRDAYVELTIKREEQGQVSRYLHDMLMTGQTVNVSAPAGKFTFDPFDPAAQRETGVTLVAGGVGVTPSMAIIRDLTDRGWPGEIDLFYVVRTPADLIFADELNYLAARHQNLHLHLSATRDAPAEWTGLRGRLSREQMVRRSPHIATRPAYICGPDAMAAAARTDLIAVGVAEDRITLESFTPAAAAKRDKPAHPSGEIAAVSPAVLTFARSDLTTTIDSSVTLLEAAEAAGVSIDYQCRAGVCGTCRCKVLSGQVTMDVRDALSDAEVAEGYILACQAKADGDVSIDA